MASSRPKSTPVVETNVRGTKHVFDAAVENGVDRVVFASSNHAVGMYDRSDPAGPETLRLDPATALDGDATSRPDSFYGVSKAPCEALANYDADRHGVEAVTVRIGWLMGEAALRDGVDPETERFDRATRLSPRDRRDLHRKAATADLPENPLTVDGVSRTDERHHSLAGRCGPSATNPATTPTRCPAPSSRRAGSGPSR